MRERWRLCKAAAVILIFTLMFGGVAGAVYAEGAQTGEGSDETLRNMLDEIVEIISERALEEIDRETLLRGAIKGVFEVLDDPHARFYEPGEYSVLIERFEGNTYGGVGIRIRRDSPGPRIVEIFPNGPAQGSGLRSGDIIIEVDGEDVSGMPLEEVGELIRGPENTQVSIVVQRGGSEEGPYRLTREAVRVPTVSCEMLDVKGKELLYVTIDEFSSSTDDELGKIIDGHREADGLLVDVRDNPGGVLSSSVNSAGHLVPPGSILKTQGRDREVREVSVDSPALDMPLVVLMNGYTASGAEILAGTARERGDALLVGDTSYGKGTVQSLHVLDGEAAFKITTAEFLLPSGAHIDGVGLIPDVYISSSGEITPGPRYAPLEGPLNPGDSGKEVLALKWRLKDLGYFHGRLNGEYGSYTRWAVARFEYDNGLSPDGVADENTISALDESADVLMHIAAGDREFDDYFVEADVDAVLSDDQLKAALVLLWEKIQSAAGE